MRKSRTVSQGTSLNFWMTFLLVPERSKLHCKEYLETSWSIYKVASNIIGQLNPRCVNNKDHLFVYTILLSAYKVSVACTVFHASDERSSLVSIPHKAPCGEESGSHNCSAIS